MLKLNFICFTCFIVVQKVSLKRIICFEEEYTTNNYRFAAVQTIHEIVLQDINPNPIEMEQFMD